MGLAAAQVAVGTTPTNLTTAVEADGFFGTSLVVRNTGSTDVFLGPAGVTTSSGFALAAGSTFAADLGLSEQVFAVCTVTGTVHVLRTGV